MSRFSRRGFLGGLLTALAAPALIRTPGLLMPVKTLPAVEPFVIPPGRPGVVGFYVDWGAGKVWVCTGEKLFHATSDNVPLSGFTPPLGFSPWESLPVTVGTHNADTRPKIIDTGRIT